MDEKKQCMCGDGKELKMVENEIGGFLICENCRVCSDCLGTGN